MLMREADKNCRGGFNCCEMGLGKTYMTTTVICANPMRTLILTPKSTILGWLETLRSASQFAFDVRVFDPKMVIDQSRPTVVVATHQACVIHLAKMCELHFQRLVVDEVHIIRNVKAKIHMKIVDLARAIPIRWGLTATPFNNHDSDIYSYIRFMFPLASTPMPTSLFKDIMFRKIRSDVFPDGKKLIINKHIYDFEFPEEKKMYAYVSQRLDEMDQYIGANRGRLPRQVVGELKLLIMLRQRQATISPQIVLNAEKRWRIALEEDGDVMKWDHTRVTKINHIAKLIENDQRDGKNTLVITHFKDEIGLLADMLTSKKVHHKILNGKTSLKQRRVIERYGLDTNSNMNGQLIDKFSKQKMGGRLLPEDVMRHILGFASIPTVVLMQIQAGGVGISMPWIHHVINTSPDWNPFLERQAIYRAYRLTTKHDVHVTQIYLQLTIDGNIHTKQIQKLTRSLHWTGDTEPTIQDFLVMNLHGEESE